MRLGYLVHNLNDAAVERRCRMFHAGGAHVSLAGFCRDESMNAAAVARNAMMLDRSQDAALAKRTLMTTKHALSTQSLRRHFDGCDALVARNLEQMVIAARIADSRPLIYECLDIHRALLGNSIPAQMIQRVEAALLRRTDMLITSSPAFIENHFNKRETKGETILVENKLLLDPIGAKIPKRVTARSEPPITIGWFGMLRCKRTLAFLKSLVQRAEGRINVLIAGKPSPAELPNLEAEVSQTEHMSFSGPYAYSDLANLYGVCDFAWSIDWFEEGLNSKWLLPNRLYEAIAHGVIPIALEKVEVGQWLKRKQAGLVVKDADDAGRLLCEMAPETLNQMRHEIAQIESEAVICSQSECEKLVSQIGSVIRP